MTKFDKFRFEGFTSKGTTNKYYYLERVSTDETKIIVHVADNHLIKTQYGYALVLDSTRVVFLKEWQVSINYYGNEVLLDKNYFNVKVWGEHKNFTESEENINWGKWLETAKEQNSVENNYVRWEK